jgi:hypothetical protein
MVQGETQSAARSIGDGSETSWVATPSEGAEELLAVALPGDAEHSESGCWVRLCLARNHLKKTGDKFIGIPVGQGKLQAL